MKGKTVVIQGGGNAICLVKKKGNRCKMERGVNSERRRLNGTLHGETKKLRDEMVMLGQDCCSGVIYIRKRRGWRTRTVH